MWQGLLALKNDQSAVQMHFVFGNAHVARDSLPCNSDGSTPPLRIAQRMRLEQTQLEGVARKMQVLYNFLYIFDILKMFLFIFTFKFRIIFEVLVVSFSNS